MSVKLSSECFSTLEECPRVILHIDADGFFATCEQAVHPELRGKPVVTGLERGIVSAASYEAKAFGIKRGVALWEVKQLCPDAIILASDYELYSLMSKRMFDILRRFTPHIEEYSIDEAFVDITGYHKAYGGSYELLGRVIQETVESELNISISIGIAQTKVLTKVASNWDKPHGLTLIHPANVELFLRDWPVEKLWGIGKRIGRRLRSRGVGTALEFYSASEGWAQQYLFRPQQEMWYELHGQTIYPVNQQEKEAYQSIQKTRTFTPPSCDREYIFSQLSKNLENACTKARRHGLATQHLGVFLKRQDFTYDWTEFGIPSISAHPIDMVDALRRAYEEVLFESGVSYRATGVTLFELVPDTPHQLALFESAQQHEKRAALYTGVDQLASRFGKHTIFLGSSLSAMNALDERMEHRRRGATVNSRGNVVRAGAPQYAQSRNNKRDLTYSRRFVNIPVIGTTL
jgi:DNA polymerase IV